MNGFDEPLKSLVTFLASQRAPRVGSRRCIQRASNRSRRQMSLKLCGTARIDASVVGGSYLGLETGEGCAMGRRQGGQRLCHDMAGILILVEVPVERSVTHLLWHPISFAPCAADVSKLLQVSLERAGGGRRPAWRRRHPAATGGSRLAASGGGRGGVEAGRCGGGRGQIVKQ